MALHGEPVEECLHIDIGGSALRLEEVYPKFQHAFNWSRVFATYLQEKAPSGLLHELGMWCLLLTRLRHKGLQGIAFNPKLDKIVFFGPDRSALSKIVSCLLPITVTSNPNPIEWHDTPSVVPLKLAEDVLNDFLSQAGCTFAYDMNSDRILLFSSIPRELMQRLGELFFEFVEVSRITLVEESIEDSLSVSRQHV
jgi:hypothetical protein